MGQAIVMMGAGLSAMGVVGLLFWRLWPYGAEGSPPAGALLLLATICMLAAGLLAGGLVVRAYGWEAHHGR